MTTKYYMLTEKNGFDSFSFINYDEKDFTEAEFEELILSFKKGTLQKIDNATINGKSIEKVIYPNQIINKILQKQKLNNKLILKLVDLWNRYDYTKNNFKTDIEFIKKTLEKTP